MNCLLACLSLFLSLCLLASRQALGQASNAAPAPLNEAEGYRFAFQYDPPRVPYIIIQVSINGRPALPFLLDTGTNKPVTIDTEAAKGLGLKMSGITSTGNDGRVSFSGTDSVKSLQFPRMGPGRNIDFSGMETLVADLSAMKEHYPEVKLAGMVGVGLLDRFTLRLDFSHKVATLYLKAHPPVAIFGAIPVPLIVREDEHRYLVRVSPSPGLSADVLLDTGSPRTSLPLAVTDQIRSAPRHADGTGLLGTYYISQTLLLPRIQVGTSRVDNFAVGSSPVSMACTLGDDLLSCFRVTLDFPHRQMFLEIAADRPYRLEGRVGIDIKPDGNGFRVKSLTPGSPAGAAGLRADDVILSVDGHPLQGLSREAAGLVIDDFANTQAVFLIQRSGAKPFSVSLTRLNCFTAPPEIVSGLSAEKPDGQPIKVIQVDLGYAAQRAGLAAGDTITALDGLPSASLTHQQITDAFSKDTLTLTVLRAREGKPRVVILAK